MKQALYLGLLFFININSLVAQTQTTGFEIPNYASKSPEAAAFLKYGEYPVNLSTGVPNISIPLYTIEAKGLKIPISLDYHSSGIKVSQEASWVGLGWNLNYGAQIILSVRDGVDENNPFIDQIPSDASINYYNQHYHDFNEGPQIPEQFDKSRVKDVYVFSSPTANGQFYISNGVPVVFPPEAFKVEATGGYLGEMPGETGFWITDPLGNTYIFGQSEISVRQFSHQDSYKSAWYVTKIRTASNDVISFTYEDDGIIEEYSKSQEIVISKNVKDCDCVLREQVQANTSPISTTGSSVFIHTKKIKEVTFNNGESKLLFERLNGRLDLRNGGSYLKTLKIMQKNSSGVFELVKGHSFGYSYFNEFETGNNLYKKKRLRLDRVETLLDGDSHEFVYSSIPLPSKDSNSQDYFGYYNGKNNSDLIPRTVLIEPYSVVVGTADRAVDANYSQAGILQQIKYPSKGYTQFKYEPNDYYGTSSGQIIKNPSVSTGTYHPDFSYNPNPEEDDLVYSTNFTVNSATTAIFQWQAANNAYANYNQTLFHPLQYCTLSILKLNSSGTVTSVYYSGQKNGGPSSSPNQEGIENFVMPNGLYLNSGNYVLVVRCHGRNVRMNGSLTFSDDSVTIGNIQAGGLRVKNISNFDSNGGIMSKKKYDYINPTEPEKSSGVWVNQYPYDFKSASIVNFTELKFGCYPIGLDPGPTADDFTPMVTFTKSYSLTSNSRYGIEGNTITYQFVKESIVDSDDDAMGHTWYKYTFGEDWVLDPAVQVPMPWKRGKLLQKTVFKKNCSTYIYRETNSYFEDHSKAAYISGFKSVKRIILNLNEAGYNFYQGVDNHCEFPTHFNQATQIFKYNIPIYWEYLKSTEVTENFFNSQNQLTGTVVTNKVYNYNNPGHMQLSEEVTTSSKGEVLTSKYYYPGDAEVAGEPYVDDLWTKHILAPLKVETFRGDYKTSERKTVYKNWGNNLLMPELVQGAKADATPETRVRFTRVDNTNGNVLELQQENGTPIVYIWGYNGLYPIAKIENATYENVMAALNTTSADLLSMTECPANIRQLLPEAMVTTFTYKPLVGVTSITDPKGYKISYAYDNQGRLLKVTDPDGNILSENEYHYKN